MGYGIESLPIMALEATARAWQRLDSRLYRENLRVRTTSEGRLAKDSGRFVLLVLYTQARVPSFTWTFIEALRQSPFNLVIVSNGNLAPAEGAALLDNCRCWGLGPRIRWDRRRRTRRKPGCSPN